MGLYGHCGGWLSWVKDKHILILLHNSKTARIRTPSDASGLVIGVSKDHSCLLVFDVPDSHSSVNTTCGKSVFDCLVPLNIRYGLCVTLESQLRINHVLFTTLRSRNPDLDGCIHRASGKNVVREWVELKIKNITLVTLDQGLHLVELFVFMSREHSEGSLMLPWHGRPHTVRVDTIIVAGDGWLSCQEAFQGLSGGAR